MRSVERPGVYVACSVGGVGLAVGLGVVALVRRDRPLHAYGSSHTGWWQVDQPAGVGVALLDVPGRRPAVVRLSRAMSITHHGPDISGVAVRIDDTEGAADLLFASTGLSRWGRYLLRLRNDPRRGPLTTLLPHHTRTGPVQLALIPRDRTSWYLAWSRPSQNRWTHVGSVAMDGPAPDPGHFDPTGRTPQGMSVPGWVGALRSPAYRVARSLV